MPGLGQRSANSPAPALSLMPYFPLPAGWYRRILAADSRKRYASRPLGLPGRRVEATATASSSAAPNCRRDRARHCWTWAAARASCKAAHGLRRFVGVGRQRRSDPAHSRAWTRAPSSMSGGWIILHARGPLRRDRVQRVALLHPAAATDLRTLPAFLHPDGIMIVCNFQIQPGAAHRAGHPRSGMVELTQVRAVQRVPFASVVRVCQRAPLQPWAGYESSPLARWPIPDPLNTG